MRKPISRYGWTAIAVSVAALVASTVALTSAGASATGRGGDGGSARSLTAPVAALSADDVADSIAYLRAKYGVSTAEALRRLNLQQEAAGLDAQLRSKYSGVYGGMWLDQQAGGVLRIAATDPSAVPLAGLPDSAHVAVQRARFTLVQLTATAQRLAGQLSRGNTPASDVAEVSVDEVGNVVAVYQRAGAANIGRTLRSATSLAGAERAVSVLDARVGAAVAAVNGQAVVRQLIVGDDKSALVASSTPPACSPKNCAPPLRGGMRLDVKRSKASTDTDVANSLWGECTVGFNMTDSAGVSYLLTAGHCVVGPNALGTNSTYDNARHKISTETFDFENGPTSGGSTYPVDYSIQQVTDYNRWLGGFARNGVDVFCVAKVSTKPCTSKTMPVTGYVTYGVAAIGTVVCLTGSGDNDPNNGYHSSGAAPGTRCGEITGKNGGIKTNICSRKGDSGGPLFSEVTGKAYGILNDGTPGHGNCPSSPAGTEWSQFSPIDKILAHVKAQTLQLRGKDYGFRLRTTG